MKSMKLMAAFLAVAAIFFCFSGCALTKPGEEEIKEAVTKLLPAAKEATKIIYGEGAPLDPLAYVDPTWTTAHYVPVDPSYEFGTKASIEKLIRAAFSENYAEGMFEYAFVGNDVMVSRYGESGGRLTREVVKSKEFEMLTDLYPETIKVKTGTKYACEVEIMGSGDGGKTKEKYSLQMAYENGKWLFDGPVY